MLRYTAPRICTCGGGERREAGQMTGPNPLAARPSRSGLRRGLVNETQRQGLRWLLIREGVVKRCKVGRPRSGRLAEDSEAVPDGAVGAMRSRRRARGWRALGKRSRTRPEWAELVRSRHWRALAAQHTGGRGEGGGGGGGGPRPRPLAPLLASPHIIIGAVRGSQK